MIRDVLSRMDLALGPTLALLSFFTVFLAMLAFVLRPGRTAHEQRMTRLPFDDQDNPALAERGLTPQPAPALGFATAGQATPPTGADRGASEVQR